MSGVPSYLRGLSLQELLDRLYDEEGVDITPHLLTPRPTAARPGSEAKIRVLAERAAAGQLLWHPRDAQDVLVVQPSGRDPWSRIAGPRPPRTPGIRIMSKSRQRKGLSS